jgi:hypothetical protein
VIDRRLLALAIGALLGPVGCSSALGATPPFCPSLDLEQIDSAIILQAQAVPSARFGPCIDHLEAGWTAHDLEAESGRAWFWLDSDRVGDRFLTVKLVESCDTGGSEQEDSGMEDISLFTRTQATASTRPFAIITVADRHLVWAEELADLLRAEGISVHVDTSDEPVSERIGAALGAGKIALIVDDVDVENGTAAVRIPELPHEERSRQDFEQIRRLVDVDENQTFSGNWFLTFAGGCIIYEFDAVGPGATTVGEEVRSALGVVPLEELRDTARRAGYDI